MDWWEEVQSRALCNPPTLRSTYRLAGQVILEGVPGDMVECGVFAGAQLAVMARAIIHIGAPKRVHAYDSFEGIPIAGPRDTDQPGAPLETDRSGELRSSGVAVCSLEQLERNWSTWRLPPDILQCHPGWFQHTVQNWGDSPIALLRLDGDLYESTRVCLEALYPRVPPGGCVIVDDYALPGCRAAVDDYLAGEIPRSRIHVVPGGGGPVWWRIE